MANFRSEIEILINKHSIETSSNTPDFILAEYLCSCLKALDAVLDKQPLLQSVDLSILAIRERNSQVVWYDEAKLIEAMETAIINVLKMHGWDIPPTHAHPAAKEAFILMKQHVLQYVINNLKIEMTLPEESV